MITTKRALTQYIREMLGEPVIRVEVTDAQISRVIDDTVQKFTEYSYGTLEEAVVLNLDGRGEYPLPYLITNILKLSKGTNRIPFTGNLGGSDLVPDLWSQQYFVSVGTGGITASLMESIIPVQSTQAIYSKYFGDDLNFNFNPHRKVLQVLENYRGKALLHYQYEYRAKDEDYIYNHEWVKAYSKAKVKEVWGGNTGKFDQTLVGGARMNYDRILSEAKDEIQSLNEELLSKWCDTAPIMVG